MNYDKIKFLNEVMILMMKENKEINNVKREVKMLNF